MQLTLALVALTCVTMAYGQAATTAAPAKASGSAPPKEEIAAPTCERQAYKAKCELNGQPSQFTLRFYLKDGKCCSYPFGFCPGDELNMQSAIRTKEDCEEFCINKGPAQKPIVGKGTQIGAAAGGAAGGNAGGAAGGAAGGNAGGAAGGNAGGSAGGAAKGGAAGGSAGGSSGGAPTTAAPATPTCDRQPYKANCTTGGPSQFTLRYYNRNGMCCSYPFGWCPADEINMQTAIRTKEACENICLGKGTAPPLPGPGASIAGASQTGNNAAPGTTKAPGGGSTGAPAVAPGGTTQGAKGSTVSYRKRENDWDSKN